MAEPCENNFPCCFVINMLYTVHAIMKETRTQRHIKYKWKERRDRKKKKTNKRKREPNTSYQYSFSTSIHILVALATIVFINLAVRGGRVRECLVSDICSVHHTRIYPGFINFQRRHSRESCQELRHCRIEYTAEFNTKSLLVLFSLQART